MADLSRIDVVAALDAAYGAVTDLTAALTSDDFDRPTRCEGLAVGPLLVHLLLDAQRALMTYGSPAAPPPDRDFVTYWRDFPAEQDRVVRPDSDPHVRFVTHRPLPRLRRRPAYALKATGRTPLDASDADLLGPDLASRLPVIR